MPKHALSFVEFHNPFFMQGSNLGNKVNAAQRGAKLILDDERHVVWVYYKQKVSFVPVASVASGDAVEIPEDIRALFGIGNPPETSEDQNGPPAIARAKRGRPPLNEQPPQPVTVPRPDFDPNDVEAAARHRELVRAASANANRPAPQTSQNDLLIQEARMQAAGLKQHTTAQVQTAQQVGETTAIAGKRKIISHAQLNAKLAAEAKG